MFRFWWRGISSLGRRVQFGVASSQLPASNNSNPVAVHVNIPLENIRSIQNKYH